MDNVKNHALLVITQIVQKKMVETKSDPFEGLFELEDTFYTEGYDLGVADGKRAGLVEGRIFGLEKGFEKYASMGRLNGKAVIWAARLAPVPIEDQANDRKAAEVNDSIITLTDAQQELRKALSLPQAEKDSGRAMLPTFTSTLRLEKHIRTLCALVEPSSLSTENTEEAVSEFDDRIKRAQGKVKIIEKITGEMSLSDNRMASAQGAGSRSSQKTSGDGNIEDINSLHARQ